MPGYQGTGQATLLRENRQFFLWQNETIGGQKASVAVQLERVRSVSYPWGVSFELWFSGDPGTYEVDIQTADVDQDSHYCTIQTFNMGSQLNANFVGRYETRTFWAKYVRAVVKTLTNSVTVSLLLTR